MALTSGCLRRFPSIRQSTPVRSSLTTCGAAVSTRCSDVGVADDPSNHGQSVTSEGGDEVAAVSVDAESDTVTVHGRTYGNGDPECRTVSLDSVRLADDVLTVAVRNGVDVPVNGGCNESLGAVLYEARLVPRADAPSVSSVRVRHLADDRTLLSGTVVVA